jgi:pimeloyl-ACP methyl ester carboxylesterase
MSVADHTAECAALLRRLDTGRARVPAHSSGCVFALQLALDHPELVSELVLVEPPLIDPLLPPSSDGRRRDRASPGRGDGRRRPG